MPPSCWLAFSVASSRHSVASSERNCHNTAHIHTPLDTSFVVSTRPLRVMSSRIPNSFVSERHFVYYSSTDKMFLYALCVFYSMAGLEVGATKRLPLGRRYLRQRGEGRMYGGPAVGEGEMVCVDVSHLNLGRSRGAPKYAQVGSTKRIRMGFGNLSETSTLIEPIPRELSEVLSRWGGRGRWLRFGCFKADRWSRLGGSGGVRGAGGEGRS